MTPTRRPRPGFGVRGKGSGGSGVFGETLTQKHTSKNATRVTRKASQVPFAAPRDQKRDDDPERARRGHRSERLCGVLYKG